MFSGKTENIAIIGCGGFIGSHLLEKLLTTTDYRIFGLDLTDLKIRHLLKYKALNFLHMDFTDLPKVKDVISRCDTVISLAAICNPSLYNRKPVDVINIDFTKSVDIIKLCSDLKCKLIQFSTCEVYGKTLTGLSKCNEAIEKVESYLLSEDNTNLIMGPICAQRWSYAAAKQLLERMIYAYGFEYDLDYTIIRPFNFIGPRMDFIPGVDGEGIPRVLACFMESLLFKKPLKLVDGGTNRRCFTYIDDAIDAIILILKNVIDTRQQIFNIGNPHNEITIKELALLMINLHHQLIPESNAVSIGTENVSSQDFYGTGYEDSDRRLPDISKIGKILGWKPKTDLETALRLIIKSYIKEYTGRF